jgi:hypothetical protein
MFPYLPHLNIGMIPDGKSDRVSEEKDELRRGLSLSSTIEYVPCRYLLLPIAVAARSKE